MYVAIMVRSIVSEWNKLPEEIVAAETVKAFKIG